MKIIKRNGSEATFDIVKIIAAVTKANNVVSEDERLTPMQIRRIAESVENNCLSMNRALSVEEIQDLVENQIMAHGAFEVAKNYITYRYTRTLVRKSNTTDDRVEQRGGQAGELQQKPHRQRRPARLYGGRGVEGSDGPRAAAAGHR